MCLLQFFKDVIITLIIPMLTIIISLAALYALYRSVKTSEKSLGQRILSELMSEYRSPELGNSIMYLWHFYRKECNYKENELIDKYIKIYNNNLKRLKTSNINENTLALNTAATIPKTNKNNKVSIGFS